MKEFIKKITRAGHFNSFLAGISFCGFLYSSFKGDYLSVYLNLSLMALNCWSCHLIWREFTEENWFLK